MPEQFRRVLTGRTDAGRSVVTVDDRVEFAALGAADFFRTTAAPASIRAGDQLDAGGASRLDSSPSGTIFRFFEIPPEASAQDPLAAERAAVAAFAAADASHCRVDTTRHPM